MSWYVRKAAKPLSLEQSIYYSFENKETQNQANKKQVKQSPSHDNKPTTEKEKQPKKRKLTPLPVNAKSMKKKILKN